MRSRPLRARCVGSALALALVALVAAPAGAQSMPVPVEVQVPLLLKVLRYERGLEERPGDHFVLAVLYQGKVRESLAAKDDVLGALRSSPESALGRPLRTIEIDLDSRPLATALAQEKIDFLYVTPLRAVEVTGLAEAASKLRILTLSGVPDDVRRGLAVGIDARRNRPVVLINLEAAAASGASFDSELLKIAQIVGREAG